MPDSIQDALAAVSSDNVVTGLEFLVQTALDASPEKLYADDPLYRALAAASDPQIHAAKHRLKVKFGKDFSSRRFDSLIREARAQLESTLPTSGFLLTSQGSPKSCLANAIIQLAASALDVRYDQFSARAIHQKPSPWNTDGQWSDQDDSEATNYLQKQNIGVATDVTHEAILTLAKRRQYHQVRDWLNSLKWDGTERLSTLFPNYFGAEDNQYTRAVSKAWMISAIARTMQPGCQAKYMPVLEGEQDQGKSKGLRGLVNGHFEAQGGRQWFRDRMPKLDDKDLGMYLQGVWVIEVAELSTFRGAQWEDVKAFISTQSETFRVPYGRNMQDYPRQMVFAATTNEDQWGGDRTGLVRFWPMRAGRIDFDAIIRDHSQLWAEAKFLFDEGHQWHLDGPTAALAREEQAARQPDDEWREHILAAVEKLVMNGEEWMSTHMIMEAIPVPMEKRKIVKYNVGAVMRSCGWKRKQKRVTRGENPKDGWERGE